MGNASLESGGSDSLGLHESLCGVVWRCMAGQEGQYSSAGAAVKGFNRVEEAVS